MNKLARSTLFLSFFIFVFYAIIIPQKGDYGDTAGWAEWATFILNHGLKNVYDSGTNYLPGHLYELKLFTLFFNSETSIVENINCLKLFTLLFDITGALLVCTLVNESSKQNLVLLVIMLNPAYIHNTILWGQFDSVFSTLCFASFLAAYKKRFLLSSVLYLISLNFKLQAIIFLPALFLFLIYQSELKINRIKFLKGVLMVVVVQLIILLPFILNSRVSEIPRTLKSLSGEFGQISLNAANIWQLLIGGGNLRWMSDKIEFWAIPLKRWGLLLTATGFLIALFPMIKAIVNKWRENPDNLSFLQLTIMFGLSVLVFFFFNTQMHERYTFPAFLFIASIALLTEKWWLYGLFSIAYFLNNESCLQSFKEYDYKSFIFDLRFSSALFMMTILFLLFYLYRSLLKGMVIKK